MAEFEVGQTVKAEVELRDASGDVTAIYDQAQGVTYTLSHPDSMVIADTDANPLDVEVEMVSPVEGATITVTLDGDPSAGERLLTLESEQITIRESVPEGAVSGVIRFVEITPA